MATYPPSYDLQDQVDDVLIDGTDWKKSQADFGAAGAKGTVRIYDIQAWQGRLYEQGLEHPAVKVVVNIEEATISSTNYNTAYEIALKVRDDLLKLNNDIINTTVYVGAWMESDVYPTATGFQFELNLVRKPTITA